MTAPACGSCTAPVPDGYLCSGCTRDLAMLLLTAASIAPDLDDAVAKLLKRGSGGRRSETDAPLPVDLAAGEVRALLRLVIAGWARRVSEDDDQLPDARSEEGYRDIAALAQFAIARLSRARQHPAAAEQLSRTRAAVQRALAVIDRAPEKVSAGLCDNCGRQLLAELGADTVRCACGMTALALQDRRRERAAAADVLGTAAEISGALDRIGIRVPRGTITSWASRGRLVPRPGGVYALSDVLALHAAKSARLTCLLDNHASILFLASQ